MKRFNLSELIWLIILIALELLFAYMLISGKAFLLVQPRMKKYIILSIAILLVFIVMQLFRIFTMPSRNSNLFGYLIFFVAIGLIYSIFNINITTTAIELNGISLVHHEHKNHIKDHNIPVVNLDQDNIFIDNDNLHGAIELFSDNIDFYVGKNIEIDGVFYKENNNDNKFIITQADPECCIVDSNYLGILCISNDIKNIKNGDEVRISGKIDKTDINIGNSIEQVPLIIVDDIIK